MDSACVYLDILVLNANVSTTFQILAAAYNHENMVSKKDVNSNVYINSLLEIHAHDRLSSYILNCKLKFMYVGI